MPEAALRRRASDLPALAGSLLVAWTSAVPLLHLSGTLVGRIPLSRTSILVGMFVVHVAIFFIPVIYEKLTRGSESPSIRQALGPHDRPG